MKYFCTSFFLFLLLVTSSVAHARTFPILLAVDSPAQIVQTPGLIPGPAGTPPTPTSAVGGTPTTPPATTPTAGVQGTSPTAFVPLTSLPGVKGVSGQVDFVSFFNSLYKVCIGLAATLAVLQIIRAGVTWMMAGDSSEKVSQAKKLIANSVFGLVLVLSPVILFGIINPNILSLNLNVSGVTSPSPSTSGTPTPTSPSGSTLPGAGGTPSSGDSTVNSCPFTVDEYAALPSGKSCSDQFGAGSQPISTGCCDNSATPEAGYTCCGHAGS
ncbi:hypothetical protein H0X32_03820 [Patescibacteria group bacterium]|nr:hypothetical protein [Patescibacteria group bacterium]